MRHRRQPARRDAWRRYTARHDSARARCIGLRKDEPWSVFSLAIVRPGARALFRLLGDALRPAVEAGHIRNKPRRLNRARQLEVPLEPTTKDNLGAAGKPL